MALLSISTAIAPPLQLILSRKRSPAPAKTERGSARRHPSGTRAALVWGGQSRKTKCLCLVITSLLEIFREQPSPLQFPTTLSELAISVPWRQRTPFSTLPPALRTA